MDETPEMRRLVCCQSEPECPLCPLLPVNATRTLPELQAAGLRANFAAVGMAD